MLLFIAAGGVVALAGFIRYVLGIIKDWRHLRSNNPAADYATRTELREVHGRVDGFMMAITAEMNRKFGELLGELKSQQTSAEQHRSSLNKDLGAIERSLGRLEGQEGLIQSHTDAIKELQARGNGD